MAMLKTYRIVLTTTSVSHNLVTGTTASSTGPYTHEDVGVALTLQNQSTGAFDMWVGVKGVIVGPYTSTASTGPFGIKVAQNGTYVLNTVGSSRGANAHEVWIVSTSSLAIAVGQLQKHV